MITKAPAPPHAHGYEVEKLIKQAYERGRKDGIAFERRQQQEEFVPYDYLDVFVFRAPYI